MRSPQVVVRLIDADSSPLTITGLNRCVLHQQCANVLTSRFTLYTVAVRAKTTAGPGPFTSVLTVLTAEDFPGPPSTLQAVALRCVLPSFQPCSRQPDQRECVMA